MKIAIIGSSGMLGKVVLNYFRMFAKDIQLIIPRKYNFDNKNVFINSFFLSMLNFIGIINRISV